MTVPLVLRYWVKLVHIVDESITQGGADAGKLLKHCTSHRLLCSTTVPYPCTSFLIHSHSLLRVNQSVIITPTRRHGTLQDRDCQGSQQKGHTGGGGDGWDRMKTLKHRAGFPKKIRHKRPNIGAGSSHCKSEMNDGGCKWESSRSRKWIQKATGGRWSSEHLSCINIQGNCFCEAAGYACDVGTTWWWWGRGEAGRAERRQVRWLWNPDLQRH